MEANVTSTERVYYKNTYLSELEVKIVAMGKDENGDFVVFDKTIFHPQGGGQPDDQGTIEIKGEKFVVKKLWAPRNPQEVPNKIHHYYEKNELSEGLLEIGQTASQVIDMEKRKLYARYHSAGHLISNAVHQLYPQLDGCNGNHFPKTAFVIFEGGPLPDLSELKHKVNERVNQFVQSKLPAKINWEDTPRTIQFGDLPPYPCGGTHVANISEIGEITVRNAKKSSGKLRVGYDIKE